MVECTTNIQSYFEIQDKDAKNTTRNTPQKLFFYFCAELFEPNY